MENPEVVLLEKKLLDAGNYISPSLEVSELLKSLQLLEKLLNEVEQTPPESTREALLPARNALVTEELLKHSDPEIKVAVASCICEISRITAPESPYADSVMKEVFQLIVSCFEDMGDKSSHSYAERICILETLAKVRLCVMMLDLECDDLILEMIRRFFRIIRDDNADDVFSWMETVMTLVLEESEEISVDLLSSILNILKKDDEDVLPIARKLAEDVFFKCSSKIKPYLLPVLRSTGTSLGDYRKAVADVFLGGDQAVEPIVGVAANNPADENDLVTAPSENVMEVAMKTTEDVPPSEEVGPSTVRSPNTVMSNDQGNEDIVVSNDNSKEADHDSQGEKAEPSKTLVDSVADVVAPKSKTKSQKSTRGKGRKPNSTNSSLEPFGPVVLNKQMEVLDIPEYQGKDGKDDDIQSEGVDAAEAACNENPSEVPVPSLETFDNAHVDISSPSPIGSLADETCSKNTGQTKKKEHPLQEESVTDFDSKKDSEGPAGLEGTLKQRASEKSSPVSDMEESLHGSPNETEDSDKIIKLDGTSDKDLVQEAEIEGSQCVNEIKQVQIKKEDDEIFELDGTAEDLVQKAEVEGIQCINKKKQGQTKATPVKGDTKTAVKYEKKKTVALPKTTRKTAKDGSGMEKSKSNSKRKRPSEPKAPQTKVFGGELVGATVEIWWPNDVQFYKGVVKSFNNATKEHMVFYDDGDVEVLKLKDEKWKLVIDPEGLATDGGSSDGAADETPIGKLAKTSANKGVKQGKTMSSTKMSGASSSKSKTTPKSGSVLKDDNIIASQSEGESSKKVGKSEVEKSGKSKPSKVGNESSKDAIKPAEKSTDDEDTPIISIKSILKADNKVARSKGETSKKVRISEVEKSGKSKPSKVGNTSEDTTKLAEKSKDEGTIKISIKSKQDTPKGASKSKGKSSPKTFGKSNPNTSGKVKAGTSIIDVEMDDESLEPVSTLEKSKEKSESTPKTQKSSTKRKQNERE